MTAVAISAGAPLADDFTWKAINWQKVEDFVYRLQMRIAKATGEGKYGKAKALQYLLTHSFYAKLMAVKRVTENRGSKTAGVDGVIWKNMGDKLHAARSLKRKGYHPQPLRRIYIPKRKGTRPLGIPTMQCRAQQALHLLALAPISETLADLNSYGFRPKRSCHDAIEQCFKSLAKGSAAQWILEGDIKACFDQIDHKWLESNIPMDKRILRKWLNAGYMEKNVFNRTERGTPQGGIISPTLANLVLDGMEALIDKISAQPDKANFIRYADDFVITGSSKEFLQNKVKPAIVAFLQERGLELSENKTKTTHIGDGFDFLSFNIRKYDGKLLIKPSKECVLSFLRKIRELIKTNKTISADALIRILNSKIRGWVNYYRHAVSKDIFSYVDHVIVQTLLQWAKRRHPEKGAYWVVRKYFRNRGSRNWIFFAKVKDKKGNFQILDLITTSDVSIKRHIKVRAAAHPFDSQYIEYFENRDSLQRKSYMRAWDKAKIGTRIANQQIQKHSSVIGSV